LTCPLITVTKLTPGKRARSRSTRSTKLSHSAVGTMKVSISGLEV
jgi:hypothetical protein